MARRASLAVVAIALAALAAAGCTRTVTGSGPVASHRFVGPFDRVVVAGPFDVRIRQEPLASVTIRTNRDLMGQVSVVISQGVAHVDLLPRVDLRGAGLLEATVEAPVLSLIDLSSSARGTLAAELRGGDVSLSVGGDSRLDGRVDVSTLALEATDGSSLSVSGRADDVALDAESSARVDAVGVEAGTVELHLDRAAIASVWATTTMSAKVSRESRATYRGHPTFEDRVVTSGATLLPA